MERCDVLQVGIFFLFAASESLWLRAEDTDISSRLVKGGERSRLPS